MWGRGCQIRSKTDVAVPGWVLTVTLSARWRPQSLVRKEATLSLGPACPFVPVQGVGSTDKTEKSLIQLWVRELCPRQLGSADENPRNGSSAGQPTAAPVKRGRLAAFYP